jgi:hypothetical protein
MRARQHRRADDFFERRVGLPKRDVLTNRPAEQQHVLRHDTDLRAQAAEADLPRVVAVNEILPSFGSCSRSGRLANVVLPAPLRPMQAFQPTDNGAVAFGVDAQTVGAKRGEFRSHFIQRVCNVRRFRVLTELRDEWMNRFRSRHGEGNVGDENVAVNQLTEPTHASLPTLRTHRRLPNSASHNLTMPSAFPPASIFPSREKATHRATASGALCAQKAVVFQVGRDA